MHRGVNFKKVLVTLDDECLALLEKYHSWGTNKSAHVRKALKAYEFRTGKTGAVSLPIEDTSIEYD